MNRVEGIFHRETEARMHRAEEALRAGGRGLVAAVAEMHAVKGAALMLDLPAYAEEAARGERVGRIALAGDEESQLAAAQELVDIARSVLHRLETFTGSE